MISDFLDKMSDGFGEVHGEVLELMQQTGMIPAATWFRDDGSEDDPDDWETDDEAVY